MTVETPTARSAQTLEERVRAHPERFRVLTGDRPTGPLHLGHYFGTLANRVRLQRAGVEVFLVIADYQVITDRDGVGDLSRRGAGARPRLPRRRDRSRPRDDLRAQRGPGAQPAGGAVPQPRDRRRTAAQPDGQGRGGSHAAAAGSSGLLFTYPVHQAADILFCHGNLVPVGKDQLPHVEVTRSIARRFNERYAAGATDLPRARGAAQRRAGPAGHRRAEDEQEPRQHDRARRRRGPHRRAAAARQDGQSTARSPTTPSGGPEIASLLV